LFRVQASALRHEVSTGSDSDRVASSILSCLRLETATAPGTDLMAMTNLSFEHRNRQTILKEKPYWQETI
jgi:hypothetical protein